MQMKLSEMKNMNSFDDDIASDIPLLGCIMFNLVFEISQSYFIEDVFLISIYNTRYHLC